MVRPNADFLRETDNGCTKRIGVPCPPCRQWASVPIPKFA
jgi:hypothetical protein